MRSLPGGFSVGISINRCARSSSRASSTADCASACARSAGKCRVRQPEQHRGRVRLEAQYLLRCDVDVFGGIAPEGRDLFAQLLLNLGVDLRAQGLVGGRATLIQQRIDLRVAPVVPAGRRAAGVECVEQILIWIERGEVEVGADPVVERLDAQIEPHPVLSRAWTGVYADF